MKTVIATTTGFHLRRLAVELAASAEDVQYFSYTPRFRMRQEGPDAEWAHSMFSALMPTSALALMRGTPWQLRAVESMLSRTDNYLARRLPASDVFIGLSSMAVRSAAQARRQGAQVVIERGSRHVLSQQDLISGKDARPLSAGYIERELASYEQADYITIPSRHAAESFEEAGFPKERLFTCPLGVDLERFRPSPRPPGPLRLLFVGSWSYQKGVDVLVQALNRRPDWSLTHVGMTAGFEFPIDHPRVKSVGYRSHSQLPEVMAEHHVLVLPSRQDGFGMVLLEALSAGLPVVASRMTGGPDIQAALDTPQWVELVEAGDVDDLVRGLDSMSELEAATQTPGLRRRLSPRDESFFSWRSYGARYLSFLRSICGDGA